MAFKIGKDVIIKHELELCKSLKLIIQNYYFLIR